MKAVAVWAMVLAALPASAEWVKLKKEAEGWSYVDSRAIRDGDLSKVWLMYSYSNQRVADGKQYQSSKLLKLFDCKRERVADSAVYSYTNADGTGNLMMEAQRGIEWRDVVPATVDEAVMKKVACK